MVISPDGTAVVIDEDMAPFLDGWEGGKSLPGWKWLPTAYQEHRLKDQLIVGRVVRL